MEFMVNNQIKEVYKVNTNNTEKYRGGEHSDLIILQPVTY